MMMNLLKNPNGRSAAVKLFQHQHHLSPPTRIVGLAHHLLSAASDALLTQQQPPPRPLSPSYRQASLISPNRTCATTTTSAPRRGKNEATTVVRHHRHHHHQRHSPPSSSMLALSPQFQPPRPTLLVPSSRPSGSLAKSSQVPRRTSTNGLGSKRTLFTNLFPVGDHPFQSIMGSFFHPNSVVAVIGGSYKGKRVLVLHRTLQMAYVLLLDVSFFRIRRIYQRSLFLTPSKMTTPRRKGHKV
jgi:hypothetical protein